MIIVSLIILFVAAMLGLVALVEHHEAEVDKAMLRDRSGPGADQAMREAFAKANALPVRPAAGQEPSI
jgi:high-affinity Fe2+/Pb2+ permease